MSELNSCVLCTKRESVPLLAQTLRRKPVIDIISEIIKQNDFYFK